MRNASVRRLSLTLIACSLVACGQAQESFAEDTPNAAQDLFAVAPSIPTDVWTWISVPGARCANGDPTGFAVNLAANSNRLVMVYEGGGACYDALTCYGLQTGSYVATGYDENTFRSHSEMQWLQTYMLTNRNDPNNVFANVNYAYVPYCTGDVHSGNNIITYPGMHKPTYHVGFTNGHLYTQLLAQQLPNVDHVWVTGYSAGGFGATFHYADTQALFPQARIDLVDDSGESFPDQAVHNSWNMQLPEDCTTCDANDFSTLVRYYSHTFPESRFATLSYADDRVLPVFFGMTELSFMSKLHTYEGVLDSMPNTKYFVYGGRGHVLTRHENRTIGHETLSDWMHQMVSDDPNWTSRRGGPYLF